MESFKSWCQHLKIIHKSGTFYRSWDSPGILESLPLYIVAKHHEHIELDFKAMWNPFTNVVYFQVIIGIRPKRKRSVLILMKLPHWGCKKKCQIFVRIHLTINLLFSLKEAVRINDDLPTSQVLIIATLSGDNKLKAIFFPNKLKLFSSDSTFRFSGVYHFMFLE